jgi:hypothetical protein
MIGLLGVGFDAIFRAVSRRLSWSEP